MKAWFWLLIPAAFFAGLTAGRWNPAPQMRAPGRGAERARESPGPAATLAPVTGMLRIPDRVETAAPDREADGPKTADARPDTPAPQPRPARRPRPEGQTLEERIEWAADAWRLRSDIARDTFLADAGLDRSDSIQFDVLMHAMNLRLEDIIDRWADEVALRDAATPEDSVRLLNELTAALVITYDEMDRTLPPRWRAAAGDRFDLVTFVDPTVARPLISIEQQLERAGVERTVRGRRR